MRRHASPRPGRARPAAELFEQLRAAMLVLAERGWAHGDLSPYNVLLHRERLVHRLAADRRHHRQPPWLRVPRAGRPQHVPLVLCPGLAVDEGELLGDLMAEATSRW